MTKVAMPKSPAKSPAKSLGGRGKRLKQEAPRDDAKQHRDELLDQALADTFPASDPVAQIEPAPSKD
jgi:hypothetical protein